MIPAPAAAPLRGPPPSPTMRRIVLPGAPSAEPLPAPASDATTFGRDGHAAVGRDVGRVVGLDEP